jgi:hypothetical protein
MKGLINILNAKLVLTALFSLMVIVGSAQVPSKGVQKYANKKAYAKAEQQTNILSVTTPQVAVSKDVHKANNTVEATASEGNMISEGFPYWTIAKGVHVHHSSPEFREEYIAREK